MIENNGDSTFLGLPIETTTKMVGRQAGSHSPVTRGKTCKNTRAGLRLGFVPAASCASSWQLFILLQLCEPFANILLVHDTIFKL